VPHTPEHRRHPRITLSEAARLLFDNDEERNCAILDLSLSGAALVMPHPVMQGIRCMASFDIDSGSTRKRINALGETVYAQAIAPSRFRVGIKFIDMDAYSELLLRELALEHPAN